MFIPKKRTVQPEDAFKVTHFRLGLGLANF
jgi:hypothetical protein